MDEFEAVGVPYAGRGKRGDEFLRCLKAIWTEDPVEFAGEFYRVPRARVEPRPVQTPHPPITIGGYGPTVVRRAVTYDGFNGGNVPLQQVAPLVAAVLISATRGATCWSGTLPPLKPSQLTARRTTVGP